MNISKIIYLNCRLSTREKKFENRIIHAMLRIFGSKMTLVPSGTYVYKMRLKRFLIIIYADIALCTLNLCYVLHGNATKLKGRE